MATHRTDVQIDASDEQVWAVLVDFENYADWNPALPSISGDLREGCTVSLTLALPGRPNLNIKAKLLEVTPNGRLTWRGHLGSDRRFTGYREFAIQPLAENKVRFTHVEELQGLIAPVFGALMGRSVQRHHDTFNESLKSRAEAMAGQQPQRARDGAERCLCIDAACRRCGRRIVPACRPSQDGMRGGPVTSISYSAAAGANGAGLGGSLGGAMVTSCAGSASPLMKPSQRVPH